MARLMESLKCCLALLALTITMVHSGPIAPSSEIEAFTPPYLSPTMWPGAEVHFWANDHIATIQSLPRPSTAERQSELKRLHATFPDLSDLWAYVDQLEPALEELRAKELRLATLLYEMSYIQDGDVPDEASSFGLSYRRVTLPALRKAILPKSEMPTVFASPRQQVLAEIRAGKRLMRLRQILVDNAIGDLPYTSVSYIPEARLPSALVSLFCLSQAYFTRIEQD